jgi:oxygen-dependent protoporphyrinogen oxidase
MPERQLAPRVPVVVVGGGITGLATAHYLQARHGVEAVVVEASDRVGGKIRTNELAGVPVEAGPDSFLARVPWAADLCRELGLGDELIEPATSKAFVWVRGRLRALPPGLVLGVPTGLPQLAASGLVSPAGMARAALDVVLPRRRHGDDPSIAEVIGARFGREVVDNLVEPLLGGINAGRADRLSLAATAPQLADAARDHRSLLLGLRVATAGGPVFQSVRGGLERLVERLGADIDVRTSTAAGAIERAPDGRWKVAGLVADAVVVTVPAFAAAPLLQTVSPVAAAELRAIEYASVALVTLGYAPSTLPSRPAGSGFLVPRTEHRLMTACTFLSAKWPTVAASGLVLLRVSAGRLGDARVSQLDDDELVDRVHREVAEALGAGKAPVTSRVDRWVDGFPQYEPGHLARVDRIEAALAGLPGLTVAGAAYRGLGLAACVRQAGEAADRIAAYSAVGAAPRAAGDITVRLREDGTHG